MLAVQSINFVCTDFWSLYLVQMRAEIRVSIADVDLDPYLNRYWPPSTSVHRGSCSETDSATRDQRARRRTQKYGQCRMESVKSVFFRKVWPPPPLTGRRCKDKWQLIYFLQVACQETHLIVGRKLLALNLLFPSQCRGRWDNVAIFYNYRRAD